MGFAFLFIFIFIIVVVIASMKQDRETREWEHSSQESTIRRENIQCDADYQFRNSINTLSARFIIDKKNRKVLVSNNSHLFTEIPFSGIVGCEILTDSTVTGGVGRALVGGVIAGGVGAVVGAATASKKITSYQVIIYKDDIVNPSITIDLINNSTETDSSDYKSAVEFAQHVNASVKVIVESNNKDATQNAIKYERSTTPTAEDSAGEIRKFKKLFDEGIITEEEFIQKKKQLLGLKASSEVSAESILSIEDLSK